MRKMTAKQTANVEAQFASMKESEVEKLLRERKERREADKAASERLKALGVDTSARKLPDDAAHGGLVSFEVGEVEGVSGVCAVITVRLGDRSLRTKDGRPYLFQLSGSEAITVEGISGPVVLGGPWAVIGKAPTKAK